MLEFIKNLQLWQQIVLGVVLLLTILSVVLYISEVAKSNEETQNY
jgi:hypothetical protein